MSFSVVHTADLHLDRNFSYLSDDKAYARKEDLLNAFHQIVDFVLENKVDALLISGDTFDKVLPRNPAKVDFVQKIREIKENGTNIFIIGGNHDVPKGSKHGIMAVEILSAAGLANVFGGCDAENVSFKTIVKNNEKLNIHGLSFNPFLLPETVITPKINFQEGYNVLMIHGDLEGINSNEKENMFDNPIKSSFVEQANLDYLALGHYHNFAEKEYDGTIACYSGSSEKMTFNEENDKKCFVHLEIDNSGVDYEKIPLKIRDIKTLNVQVDDSIENIDQMIKNKVSFNNFNPELILRLKLRGNIRYDTYNTLHKAKLYDEYIKNYFWFIIEDELELDNDELNKLDKLDNNPYTLFESRMNEKIEKLYGSDKEKHEKALELGLNVLSQVNEEN
ncbi:MAG: exonuclease SbcCD subunit D [Methanobrevibacter sp.]|jgi:DNA repair exonuclease SbcCD nuclease subunit|nr:exonuclease SbcCD subunit D [Methanobrevibacter sp.]